MGYAQFCLAWIEVQEGKYTEAISRLEASLAKGNITDRELAAEMRFKIGKVYLAFLFDDAHASESFEMVRKEYPDTRIARHPYVVPVSNR